MALLLEWFSMEFLKELFIELSSCARMIISALLFMAPLPRKPHKVLRMMLAAILCIAALYGSVLLRINISNVYTRALMFAVRLFMPITMILLCCEGDMISRLRVACASMAAVTVGYSFYNLLMLVTGNDPRITLSFFPQHGEYNTALIDWLLMFVVNTIIYYLLFCLFRYDRREELDRESGRATVFLTVFCLLIQIIANCLSSGFLPDGNLPVLVYYRLSMAVVGLFILLCCSSITFRSHYRAEKQIMDQVLQEEQKQYQQLKENINIINARCHDLKHQLDDFSDRLSGSEIASLREAMDFYDSNIKTGCEVLDVVLRIAQMTCDKERVVLTCLADGACLSFMETRHVYSLFNNALANAMEAVRKVKEPNQRIISLSVRRCDGCAEIEVTNYYDGNALQPAGTSKADVHHHGFGIQSMGYIAAEYGGSLAIRTQGAIFTLTITIPILLGNEYAK